MIELALMIYLGYRLHKFANDSDAKARVKQKWLGLFEQRASTQTNHVLKRTGGISWKLLTMAVAIIWFAVKLLFYIWVNSPSNNHHDYYNRWY